MKPPKLKKVEIFATVIVDLDFWSAKKIELKTTVAFSRKKKKKSEIRKKKSDSIFSRRMIVAFFLHLNFCRKNLFLTGCCFIFKTGVIATKHA